MATTHRAERASAAYAPVQRAADGAGLSTGYQLAALHKRIRAHIVIDASGCWLWTGEQNRNGYGRVSFGTRQLGTRRRLLIHRYVYMTLVGPIPAGLQLDHLCRVRLCCNPGHLEPVTLRENCLRGQSPNILIHHSGTCAQGHPRAIYGRQAADGIGSWRCLECRRLRARAPVPVAEDIAVTGAGARIHSKGGDWLSEQNSEPQQEPEPKDEKPEDDGDDSEEEGGEESQEPAST